MELSFCLVWNKYLCEVFMKNKKNKWYIVRVATKEDYEQVFDRCLEKGYRNVCGLSNDSFPVPLNVILICDSSKQFGLTNVTCMAAVASQGKRPIDAKALIEKNEFKRIYP